MSKFKQYVIYGVAVSLLLSFYIYSYDVPLSVGQIFIGVILLLAAFVMKMTLDKSETFKKSDTISAINACRIFWATMMGNEGSIASENLIMSGVKFRRRIYTKRMGNTIDKKECLLVIFPKGNKSHDMSLFIYSFTDNEVVDGYDNVSEIELHRLIIEYTPFDYRRDPSRAYGGKIEINTGSHKKYDIDDDDYDRREQGEVYNRSEPVENKSG